MSHIRQWIGMCVIFGLILWCMAAENSSLADNPYATIVDRNIFSLVPIPLPAPPESKPIEPPAKITPNGIMSIFGQLQALFKVATPTKPGQPAQDKSYTLSVGERQDDIEVTRIDEVARIITFNNHGVMQELSLTNAIVTTPAAPVGGSGAPTGAPGFVRPPNLPGGPINRFGGRFGQGNNLSNPYSGNNPSASSPSNFAGNTGRNIGQQSEAENLSPEAQVIAIEAQRAQFQQQGNPAAAILPPTAITPKNNDPNEPPMPQ